MNPNNSLSMMNRAANAYIVNEIESSSPEKLILILYDKTIEGCKKNDEKLVSKILVELIDSLNFEYSEIATGFLGLYEYCLNMVKQGNFQIVEHIITELRDTWKLAMKKNNSPT